jgi:hypothetical protein
VANVIGLFGNPTGERTVVESAVSAANDLNEMVQSGEVIGFALVKLHCDGASSWTTAGRIGGYSMIGGLEFAKQHVMRANEDG